MEKINDLEKLKFLLKKNPSGYQSDLADQIRRFNAIFDTVKMRLTITPSQKTELPPDLKTLIKFLSTVPLIINDELKKFSANIFELTKNTKFLEGLSQDDRLTIIQSAIQLHNRNSIATNAFLQTLFNLFSIPHKELRKTIRSHIVKSLVSRPNKLYDSTQKTTENNKTVKQKSFYIFLSEMVESADAVFGKKAVSILSDLYRRNACRNAKTVNIVSKGVFSKHATISRTACWFLLGEDGKHSSKGEKTRKEAEREKEREENMNSFLERKTKGQKIGKNTAKTLRKLKRINKGKLKLAKDKEDGEDPVIAVKPQEIDFGPIRSLNDPYGFAEKLFRHLKRSRENFKTRLLTLKLLSRVVSCHEIVVTNLFSFFQRYLLAHQKDILKVLAYLVQSCHKGTPPLLLEPCINVLVKNFVTDRSSPEVIAAGLNAIQGICSRQPLAMNSDMLRDLSLYKNSHEKSVSSAARGLINLFRQENPSLLSKRDRGRPQIVSKNTESSDSEEVIEITPEFPVAEAEIMGDVITRKLQSQEIRNIAEKANKFKRSKKKAGATNEDKVRNKNFKMTQHSRLVSARSKRSLRAKQTVEANHKKRMQIKSRRKFKKKTRQ